MFFYKNSTPINTKKSCHAKSMHRFKYLNVYLKSGGRKTRGKKGIYKTVFVTLLAALLICIVVPADGIAKSTVVYKTDKDKICKNSFFVSKGLKDKHVVPRLLKHGFKNLLNKRYPLSTGLFNSVIHTNCNGVEKSTIVQFGVFNDIDVDNNPGTGVNGADIRVQYLFLPWLEVDPVLAVGVLFTFNVERLSEEIKNSDFSAELEVGAGNVKVGYHSPSGDSNEVPTDARVSFMLLFALTERTRGFGVYFEPTYETGNTGKKVEVHTGYKDKNVQRDFSFNFNPAIETQVNIISTKKEGEWRYYFTRESTMTSEVTTRVTTMKNNVTRDTVFTIDKLPRELSFTLWLTPFTSQGGAFLYESSTTYDVELTISSNQLGTCRYATIKNTPKRLYVEWIPTFRNGEYHLEIETNKTDIVIQDDVDNPTVVFIVKNLGNIDIDAYWNFSNPGDFIVYKDIDMNINLDFRIGDWVAKLNAQPQAYIVSTSWLIDTTGYITIDTDSLPLSTIDLLVKGEDLGVHTTGETFSTEDFRINWTIWPPAEWNVDVTGTIDFASITIDLYLNDEWHHLWPW